MTKMESVSTTALPAECLVTVTVNASCSIPGCVWLCTKHSTYDRMPSVKEDYRQHIANDHPGFIITSRSNARPGLISPTMIDLARVELAAVVRG